MRTNPLQFAIVREDPEVECALVERFRPRRVVLVASGGCTGLTLAARFPGLDLTLVDPNPAQIAHVEAKVAALRAGETDRFLSPDGLSAGGNFEALFGVLRHALRTFVGEPDAILADAPVDHPYWPVAFDLAFSDSLLHAMFGPDATQHAPPGSYPAYFRARLERGLSDPSRHENRFLHHILFGHYLPHAPPPFLGLRDPRMTLVAGRLEDVDPGDMVHLSNVFDWMAPDAVARLAAHARTARVVTWRQLNNTRDLAPLFPDHTFDAPFEDALLAGEKSLFYARLRVGVRR
jgi:S-adenosylmethionine-diacylglycerol 3-amino-3-carboxypropyl transferase